MEEGWRGGGEDGVDGTQKGGPGLVVEDDHDVNRPVVLSLEGALLGQPPAPGCGKTVVRSDLI